MKNILIPCLNECLLTKLKSSWVRIHWKLFYVNAERENSNFEEKKKRHVSSENCIFFYKHIIIKLTCEGEKTFILDFVFTLLTRIWAFSNLRKNVFIRICSFHYIYIYIYICPTYQAYFQSTEGLTPFSMSVRYGE